MRVAIVGLGAAGCRAAMLLREKGIDVDLYEARDRVGGRLWTISSDGGQFEAGGEWFDADHARVIALAEQLGLDLQTPQQRPGKAVFQGETSDEFSVWPDVQADLDRFTDAADELTLDLESVPWQNVIHQVLDEQTLAALVDKTCLTARGKWWMETTLRSDEGDDPSEIGLLGWLCGYLHYLERDEEAMSRYRLANGGQALCERMLEEASVVPQLQQVLRRVEREADQVHLYFDSTSRAYDHVILTMPPPALRKVLFDPPLSDDKESALADCGMSRAIKISLQFKRSLWLDRGWKGRSLSDLPVMQTWDAGQGIPVLTAYACGTAAVDLLRSGDPIQTALNSMDQLCPGLKEEFVRGWVIDWIADPFAGGAFPHIRPGFVLNGWEYLRNPEGRVHFAGEYTADWLGFVEGALESAERVVEEIVSQ